MIHLQITDSITRVIGTFGLIGDLDTQHLTIGITTGIALIIGILGDRWLNRKQDKQQE